MASELIDTIEYFITLDDKNGVKSSLELLPIEDLLPQVLADIFARFMVLCFESKVRKTPYEIYKIFKLRNTNEDVDNGPTLNDILIYSPSITTEVLRYLSDTIPVLSCVNLYLLMFKRSNLPRQEEGANKIYEAFGNSQLTIKNYTSMQNKADQLSQRYLSDFFGKRIAELEAEQETKEKKKWLRNFLPTGEEISLDESLARLNSNEIPGTPNYASSDLPFFFDLVSVLPREDNISAFSLPSDDTLAEELIAGMASMGITVENLEKSRDLAHQRVLEMTKQDKIHVYKDIVIAQRRQSSQQKLLYDRVLGPANPFVGETMVDLEGNSSSFLSKQSSREICQIYGGCRMFTCTCLEDQDLDDDEIDNFGNEWFIPYGKNADGSFYSKCIECNTIIRHRSEALRYPAPNGGYRGCYDKFKCMRDHVARFDVYENLQMVKDDDQIAQEMINTLEEIINTTGIQATL